MHANIPPMKKRTCLVLAGTAPLVQAITIAQFNPADPSVTPYAANGTPVPVSFDVGTPLNPTGTHHFTVSITNSLTVTNPLTGTPAWALTGAIPGTPTGTTIQQSMLAPAVASALGTTDGLDVLAFKGGAGAVVTITLNFGNLPGGYLPAGSILAYSDVDFLETTQIIGNTTWFDLTSIVTGDITNGVVIGGGEVDTTPADHTGVSGSGTTLTLTGASAATDSPGVLIPVSANLTSLTIIANNTANPSATFYQSFAIAAVPEPSVLAITLAAPLLLLRRNRLKG